MDSEISGVWLEQTKLGSKFMHMKMIEDSQDCE